MKILVSAYACEPDKGSEPGVGWNWAKQIARFHEVWVITRANNKEVIEEEFKKNPEPNLHFVYVDLPRWMRFWKKGQRGVRTYYYLWQFAAYLKARKLVKEIKFDIAHHITFVNDWMPSFLALLNIQFVWGPIGSHPPFPNVFQPNIKSLILEKVRLLMQNIFRFFDPLFYCTLFRAKKIITINKQIQKKYPFSLRRSDRFISQLAIAVDGLYKNADRPKEHKNCSIITVGRLIYIKGFHLAIRAFAMSHRKGLNATLKIVGDGDDKKYLLSLSKKLKIDDKTVFTGNVERTKVLQLMQDSDIFLFPSFEGGGMVVLEAMAAGLPVACLDCSGPGEMVTDECGFKIKPINKEQTVKDLSDALLKLANAPELRKKMGKAGRKRVEEVYSWDKKGEFIKELYAKFI